MIQDSMIRIDQAQKDKAEIFLTFAEMAYESGLINDKEQYIKALEQREEVLPTSVGNAIAIPHCQSNSVNEPFVGFIRLNNSVAWDENEAASLIFTIAIPENTSGQLHLKTLAKLSRKLVNQDFVDAIQTDSETVIYEKLHEILKEN